VSWAVLCGRRDEGLDGGEKWDARHNEVAVQYHVSLGLWPCIITALAQLIRPVRDELLSDQIVPRTSLGL
jgi:hypothetical protein